MKHGYAYLVTDLLNKHNLPNPFYVGKCQSDKFNSNYFGSGKFIRNVVNKDRQENGGKVVNFKLKLVGWAHNKDKLKELERSWIKEMDCIWPKGYNITEGGEGGDTFTDNPNKEEVREKMKKPHKPMSESTKNKMRKPKSEEHRKNMLGAESEETRRKKRKPLEERGHKFDCICCVCKAKKGIPKNHKLDCTCGVCKAKRGETKGVLNVGIKRSKPSCWKGKKRGPQSREHAMKKAWPKGKKRKLLTNQDS